MHQIHPLEDLLPPRLAHFLVSLSRHSAIDHPSPLYSHELELIYRSSSPSTWSLVHLARTQYLSHLADAEEELEAWRGKMRRGRWSEYPWFTRVERSVERLLVTEVGVWREAVKRSEGGAFALLALRDAYLAGHLPPTAAAPFCPTPAEVAAALQDLPPLPFRLRTRERLHLQRSSSSEDAPF
ncbi:hypothetical protein JCM6882_003173 [Rhodosporidiobolus microsporus]